MTLQKALNASVQNQFIIRKKWREAGSFMKLLTSKKIIDELHLSLTHESYYADDWEICEVVK